MWQPKRVWSNKKTVWDWKKSVWLQDWELKTFDGHWKDAWDDLQVYATEWQTVSENAELDVYDSITPEPIGTPEDWIEATYTFKDYDGTVLKTWKVKDWETPTAPTDPTREATAQYTYTFAWWSPSVWPIYKNTEYTATYTATLKSCTLYITPNNSSYGWVMPQWIWCNYGDSLTVNGDTITVTRNVFHDEVSSTATANEWFTFSWFTYNGSPLTWTVTITRNMSITAVFVEETPPASWFNITINSPSAVTDGDWEPVEMPYILWFGDWDSVTAVASADPQGNGSLLTLSWNNGENVETFVSTSQYNAGREIDGEEPEAMLDDQTYTITNETTINAILIAAIGLEGNWATIDDWAESINARIGEAIEISWNTLTIWDQTVTATLINWNTGITWLDEEWGTLPEFVEIDGSDVVVPFTIIAYWFQD